MKSNIESLEGGMLHPCFDGHHHFQAVGRVHIPITLACNIQCSYCIKKTACLHENRPGVSIKVFSVDDAMEFLSTMEKSNLKISGFSGPGDPFSNPNKLFNLIRKIRAKYGDQHDICISTNGLVLHKYITELLDLQVNYMTITINTINPDTLVRMIKWINYDGTIYKGMEAATRLLANQLKSLKASVDAGIRCKVNTVIVPDINQYEIPDLLMEVKSLGAEKGNLIPLIPVKGTTFASTDTISIQEYEEIMTSAESILDQVKGCKKCRADAVFVRKVV